MKLSNNANELLNFIHEAFKKRASQMSLDYLHVLIAVKNGRKTRKEIAEFVNRSTSMGINLAISQLEHDKLIRNKIIKSPQTGRNVTEYSFTLKAVRVEHLFKDQDILFLLVNIKNFMSDNKARPLLKHVYILLLFMQKEILSLSDFQEEWGKRAQEANDAIRLFRELELLKASKDDGYDQRMVFLRLTETGIQLIPKGILK